MELKKENHNFLNFKGATKWSKTMYPQNIEEYGQKNKFSLFWYISFLFPNVVILLSTHATFAFTFTQRAYSKI